MSKNPQGNWGPYGAKGPTFCPFGWAQVNADGTLAASSGNLQITKGSAGVYTFQPLDDKGNPLHYPQNGLLADAQISDGTPSRASILYGIGATDDGILINTFNSSNAATNTAFYFKLYTTAV
jgi:hypothetical protein